MKKTTLLLLSILLSITLTAQNPTGVVFEQGTLAEALQKAKKNKKVKNLVFLDCYTTWCGPCKYMSEKIFPTEVAGNYFNENFVNIKIDMEKGEGVEIAKKYKIAAFPTFLILDGDGNEVNRIVGGGETEQFIERVRKAIDPNSSPKKKKENYETNKSYANAIAYMESLNDAYMSKELSSFINEVFPKFNSREKYSDKMWPFLAQVISEPNSKILDIVLSEKYVADELLSKTKLDATICSSIKYQIGYYVSGRQKTVDTVALDKKVKLLALLSANDVTTSYFINTYEFYNQNKLDEIAKLLNANSIIWMNQNDRYSVERLILNVKNISKEALAKYSKDKAQLLKTQYEQAQAAADKYTK